MQTLRLEENEKSIQIAADILKKGGLVAIPTETVYGLAANALDEEAVKKIFVAKGRPQDNPLIVHVSSLEEIPPLVEEVDPRLYDLAAAYWPGPLTVIMKKSRLIPDAVCAGLDTVAVRMPSHEGARKIIKASGVPLAAPSANASGRPSPTTANHVLEDIDGRIDAIVDGGPCSVGVESTVVTLATEPPTLLRPGGITPEQLEAVLGKINISHAIFEKLNEGERPQSPGMKYKHYAPRAQVTIVKGPFEKYEKFLKAQEDTVCAVCFDGEGKFFEKSIEYGAEGDSLTQAQKFFDSLRLVDEMGCKRAFVRSPETTGVGLAVYNRLLRSAAFRVIDLDISIDVIGLAGQTGAGKSTASSFLKEKGYFIIDADALARKAVEARDVLDMIRSAFGDDVFENDVLDRKKLADRAFSNPQNTSLLNSITHPEITRLAVSEMHRAQDEGYSKCVLDAPLLFDWCLLFLCSKTISIVAPENVRLERIMKRDGITESQAKARMGVQKDETFYRENSDIVIENVDKESMKKELERI